MVSCATIFIRCWWCNWHRRWCIVRTGSTSARAVFVLTDICLQYIICCVTRNLLFGWVFVLHAVDVLLVGFPISHVSPAGPFVRGCNSGSRELRRQRQICGVADRDIQEPERIGAGTAAATAPAATPTASTAPGPAATGWWWQQKQEEPETICGYGGSIG